MTSIADFLANVPFFANFSDQQRQQIAALLITKQFAAGETLFLTGDPGDDLFIVMRGQIEIFVRDTTGNKVTLTLAGPGEIFGELSLLDKGPRSASAVTLEASELLTLKHDDFEHLLISQPSLMPALLNVLGHKLRKADDLLRGHSVPNLNAVVESKLSLMQKLASGVAEFSGTVQFLVLNISVFAFWILCNLDLIPGLAPFDPYPFGFLTLSVSLEAIFLSILVLFAQNLQSARDRIRGDVEYETNLKAELEVTHLHTKVDLLYAEVLARLHRLDQKLSKDSYGNSGLQSQSKNI